MRKKKLEFWIDTADIREIEKASSWGIISGVTTNPTLIAKSGKKFDQVLTDILRINSLDSISVEVISENCEDMVEEARKLASLDPSKIVIKIPITQEGLKTVKKLCGNIRTNVTLAFSPNQAVLAAKSGADYLSVFIGRLDDIGHDGVGVVKQIMDIYRNYDFETKLVAASIRHPKHVLDVLLLGVDVITVPFDILEKLFQHPLTDIGIQKFLEDWEKVKKKV